jgi:hypothetical protein
MTRIRTDKRETGTEASFQVARAKDWLTAIETFLLSVFYPFYPRHQ